MVGVIEKLKERFGEIPWRKAGLGFLVFGLMVIFFFGGYLSVNWYLRASEDETKIERKYADWQVYKLCLLGSARAEPSKSEICFGLRYPKDWEAKEVKPEFTIFKPQVVESPDTAQDKEEPAKEYISLTITSNKYRGKTLCEEDQSQCSFHTDGIFGERITTSEAEIIFFARGENDFTLTLYKYDSAAEVVEGYNPSEAKGLRRQGESRDSYITVFEEMAKSFRFTSEVTSACEKDTDCALGIRLDQCCACAEAFTTSEIEANPTIAPFEVGKDYSGEKVVDCTNVYCSPCPTPPSGAVCVSNRCQVKE